MRTRFDAQAPTFDARAGVGSAARAIAAAVLADAAPLHERACVVEIGAGTGEIGAPLASDAARSGARYVALDASRPMLEGFGHRGSSEALLVQADAARPWPVRSRRVDVVFASRAAHLLDVGHVVAELTRVCRPGAAFLVGRVRRDPAGLRNRLRRRRRELLAAHGVTPDEGADRTKKLLAELVGLGGAPLEQHEAARWDVLTDAAAVLADWESSGTVGGARVPPDVHQAVMAELRAFAPSTPEHEVERYMLEGVRLP
jgi:SAM-dependent methyltransferase